MNTTSEQVYLPTMVAPCELKTHWGYSQVRSIWQSVLTETFLQAHGYSREELLYRKRLPEDLTKAIYIRFKIQSLKV